MDLVEILYQCWPRLRQFLTYRDLARLQACSRGIEHSLRRPDVEKAFMLECMERTWGNYLPPWNLLPRQKPHGEWPSEVSLYYMKNEEERRHLSYPMPHTWLETNVLLDQEEETAYNPFPRSIEIKSALFTKVHCPSVDRLIWKIRNAGRNWRPMLRDGFQQDRPFIGCCVYENFFESQTASPEQFLESARTSFEKFIGFSHHFQREIEYNVPFQLNPLHFMALMPPGSPPAGLTLHYLLSNDAHFCNQLVSDPTDQGNYLQAVRQLTSAYLRSGSAEDTLEGYAQSKTWPPKLTTDATWLTSSYETVARPEKDLSRSGSEPLMTKHIDWLLQTVSTLCCELEKEIYRALQKESWTPLESVTFTSMTDTLCTTILYLDWDCAVLLGFCASELLYPKYYEESDSAD
eukprot:Blabericola_migrator_1__11299@NODE_666_length_6969_cov_110_382932_g486_i0_p2_GENE_NODE_666_length_6969_cov_110_382932_g486_i0NODE_666_length_6969_cov_110_382932_g486_i0_p2_ORF_typecomplete_len405_score55_97_NODE_666_length_6969_cov_110_382932_g486_i050526266